jgi:hypothetical protein
MDPTDEIFQDPVNPVDPVKTVIFGLTFQFYTVLLKHDFKAAKSSI